VSAVALAARNLASPPVLAFAVGIGIAAWAHSSGSGRRPALPPVVGTLLSAYLLVAIGVKGGVQVAVTPVGELALPALVTLGIGVITPIVAYVVLHRFGRFSVPDAAGIAAHYGSVSIVTFTAALAFASSAGTDPEGFLPALVALLEVPGILIALLIAAAAQPGVAIGHAVREVLTGRSILLLVGGVVLGVLAGPDRLAPVEAGYTDIFKILLVVFLLDLGLKVGSRLDDLRKAGAFLVGFGLVMPLASGALGVAAGVAIGLTSGGAAVLGTMAASASYIAAPAAVAVSLPSANLTYALTASLGITFPFNLVIGIPLFSELATALTRG